MANNTAQRNDRRLSTETRPARRTTEFIAYVAALAAIVITALVVGDNAASEGIDDPFGAADALRLITYLTIGYMIARGLAKSGSRETYDEHRG